MTTRPDPPHSPITQYSDLAGVKYPGAYEDFLAMIDMVNLDLGFILSFACVYNTTFYDRLLMATLGPFVVLLVLGCTYVVALRRNRASDESVAAVKSRHLSVALFVLFVAYATVSHAIFETFVCDNLDDGESYLRADYSLKCTTTQHTAFRIYAALMVLIYPVGIPCVFGWWLWQHRYELKTAPDRKASLRLKPAADLWEPYKRDKYYYEVRCIASRPPPPFPSLLWEWYSGYSGYIWPGHHGFLSCGKVVVRVECFVVFSCCCLLLEGGARHGSGWGMIS